MTSGWHVVVNVSNSSTLFCIDWKLITESFHFKCYHVWAHSTWELWCWIWVGLYVSTWTYDDCCYVQEKQLAIWSLCLSEPPHRDVDRDAGCMEVVDNEGLFSVVCWNQQFVPESIRVLRLVLGFFLKYMRTPTLIIDIAHTRYRGQLGKLSRRNLVKNYVCLRATFSTQIKSMESSRRWNLHTM